MNLAYLIVGGASVIAGIIQNIAGFGAGIVLMLVLPHFFSLIAAPALNQGISTLMTVILAKRYIKYMEPKQVFLPIACYIAASTCVIWIIKDIDLHLLAIAFGVFMILLSIYFMFVQKNLQLKPTPLTAVLCGLLGGVLSGLFSIGSTAMALYFLACNDKREGYMGNLQFLLAVTNVVSLCMRTLRGIYTIDLLLPTAVGFAGILLGQKIGGKLSSRLDPSVINKCIYILVGLTGLETLIKQLL